MNGGENYIWSLLIGAKVKTPDEILRLTLSDLVTYFKNVNSTLIVN